MHLYTVKQTCSKIILKYLGRDRLISLLLSLQSAPSSEDFLSPPDGPQNFYFIDNPCEYTVHVVHTRSLHSITCESRTPLLHESSVGLSSKAYIPNMGKSSYCLHAQAEPRTCTSRNMYCLVSQAPPFNLKRRGSGGYPGEKACKISCFK